MNVETGALQNNNGGGSNRTPGNAPSHKKRSKSAGILSYFLLPGIIPQIKELGRGGFGYLALLIANVYQAVRILPKEHPYTKYENLGSFGIREVIAAAANNVKLDRKNLDQIVIFFAILAGMIVLVLQFAAFIILLFSGEAWAADATGGLFNTANPDTDIAFHMMREVFGIPDMFGPISEPQTIHKGLHVMLNFYNLAILLVAVVVFLYYVVVVVGETAQSGTPFGQRFSHVYAPFRLVIAIGLLVPLNHGLNGAQYVTLYAAKFGSGFATTGWIQFTKSLTNPLGLENATLIAETKAPDFLGLVEFMAVAVACSEAYKLKENKTIEKVCVQQDSDGNLQRTSCDGAGTLGTQQDIQIAFGEAGGRDGRIVPHCGKVILPVNVPFEATEISGKPGNLQQVYLQQIEALWKNSDLRENGINYARAHSKNPDDPDPESCVYGGYTCPASFKSTIISDVKTAVNIAVLEHYKAARETANMDMEDETRDLGWGGAGIWYNRIAQINGAYVVVTMSIPTGDKWPTVMEQVLAEKKKGTGKISGCEIFAPNLADEKKVDFSRGEVDAYYAGVLNEVYQYWACERKNTHNFFLDSMSAVFGLQGLLTIRDKIDEGTDAEGRALRTQVHPLAKLSALGRGLIEAAIRNLAMAMGASFLGGAFGIISPQGGAAFEAASGALVSIATIGLSIGFITYYILPFLPFIYFFFAVGSWVKSIFEAMVGAPLWALAHLRIDGDGIPGKMAMNGYNLIFEIFLRPILTIFGLLGGMATFTALAAMLNEIFAIVVSNTGGGNIDIDREVGKFEFSMHIVDVFFFTIVYAVILYMMALASFKMINLVPNNILRWMGQSVASFSDNEQDPTGNLVQYAALGGARVGGQLAGGITQVGKAGGGVFGEVFGLAAQTGRSPKPGG